MAESKSKSVDTEFARDEAKLSKYSSTKPWLSDPTYFKKVRVAGGAAMKMLMHAQAGVEKGIKTRGKPIEIMGLMIGRIDTENDRTLLVTDVFSLPVEGTETQVLAGSEEVDNYMIALSESVGSTRKEFIMGWYHSHPFDVDVNPMYFLSATDVQTQNGWQIMEDRGGNPWLAIVVDPLRSVAKGRPEFGAFRCYPPDHTPPTNMTPDGKIVADKNARLERWGAAWSSYYMLDVSYFMSGLGAKALGILSKNFLWTRMLSTTPMLEPETRDRFSERVEGVAGKVDGLKLASGGLFHAAKDSKKLAAAVPASSGLAVEQAQGHIAQILKQALFNKHVHDHDGHDHESGGPEEETGEGAGAGAGAGAGGAAAGAGAGAAADADVDMRA